MKRLAFFFLFSVILSGCIGTKSLQESVTLPIVNSPAPSLLFPDDPNVVISTIVPAASEEPFPTTNPVTLTGTFVCLPKKIANLPDTTLECAYGFLTEAFTYYGVIMDDSMLAQFQDGRKVMIQGYYKDDASATYPIEGTVKVTAVL